MKTFTTHLDVTYEGVKPVLPVIKTKHYIGGVDPYWGIKKYIGYDHLFTDAVGENLDYSRIRAKYFPYDVEPGTRIQITANFKSSIITNIQLLKIYE